MRMCSRAGSPQVGEIGLTSGPDLVVREREMKGGLGTMEGEKRLTGRPKMAAERRGVDSWDMGINRVKRLAGGVRRNKRNF
jgi:hypothetical protein